MTVNEIFFSGGTMIGGVIIALWGGYANRIKTIAVGCFIFGLSISAMGVAPNFVLYILFIFISGLAIPFLSAPTTVLLQEMVAVDIQGRVFSILQLIATTALPLGMVIFGPLADFIQIQTLLIVSGLMMAGCSLTIIRNKALVSAKDK